jgi:hypothetical protein
MYTLLANVDQAETYHTERKKTTRYERKVAVFQNIPKINEFRFFGNPMHDYFKLAL